MYTKYTMSAQELQEMQELFSVHGRVEELEVDGEFVSHMADIARQYRKHIVSAREVEEVHSTAPEYFKNEGEEKRAPVIMVGPTVSG